MLHSIILILLAIIPVVLLSTYFCIRDKNKEPLTVLISLFCFGIVSSLFVITVSYVMESMMPWLTMDTNKMSIFQVLFKALIEVALIEETAKFAIMYFVGYNNRALDETYDILIYAIFVALGFAAFENIIYALDFNSMAVVIKRCLFSVPGHVAFAINSAYFLCLAKLYKLKHNEKEAKINICKAIFVPTVLHGIFDFCLMVDNNIYYFIFIVYTILTFYIVFKQAMLIKDYNIQLFHVEKVCKNCNQKFYGYYCYNCKKKIY